MTAHRPEDVGTIGLAEATGRVWDVLVIGAGSAGALTALLLARRGLGVVLVERASFPRRKVCGCCLNAAALDGLRGAALGDLPERHGARVLTALRLGAAGRAATVRLSAGAALSRETLDAALVSEAAGAGCRFLPATRATLERPVGLPHAVALDGAAGKGTARARVVVAASGLGSRFAADDAAFPVEVAAASRIGIGATLPQAGPEYPAGTIFMAWGERGYVGLVRVERDRLDVAGAVAPELVREHGGMAAAAGSVLDEAGFPRPEGLGDARWQATPPLTSRRTEIAAEALFVIGDATGYVEPFTGEGMAWALASAHALAPLAAAAVSRPDPALAERWRTTHHQVVGRRQRLCRLVAGALRHAAPTRAAVRLLALAPGLATPLVLAVNAPPRRLAGLAQGSAWPGEGVHP